MRIAKDTVATIEYRLTDAAGTLLDSSAGRGPLSYVHGTGSLIPGLEAELEGKQGGDRLQVALPPEKGYGPRDESRVHSVSRDRLPPEPEPRVGMQLRAESPGGVQILTVIGVEEGRVRLDANHPLAGVTLHFDVTVIEVRGATPEELAHGHVHGPGGHAH
jgi:FKBP-type peptidyl-prolyl cis-trans isomerase SlyD